MEVDTNIENITISKTSHYKDFLEITKARLSVSVVFSSIAGYFLGIKNIESFDIKLLLMLMIGGYCMVGASNVFNQIIEKDLDALMDRTKNRPVVTGKVSKNHAFILGSILTIFGLVILYLINPKTAMFGAISIFVVPVDDRKSPKILTGRIP